MGKKVTLFVLFIGFTYLYSCSSSDNDPVYTPLDTTIEDDTIEVNQDTSIEIAVLANDTDVPYNGILSLGTPQHGTIEILTNGTSNTILDDTILYTPTIGYVGSDTFQYTICNASNNSDCVSGTVTIQVLPVSPVVYNLDNMPYSSLSDYNFFEGNIAEHLPVYGVVPYEPITMLFTDYAHKKRFIWMPDGVSANYTNDYEVLNFPVGTILIKTFYYENVQPNNDTRLVETRLMIRKATEWIFADYVWNGDQTEALLDNEGSYTFIEWTQNGETLSSNYRIPSATECHTCHKKGEAPIPIGPKPQNLNRVFDYAGGEMNQLEKLVEMGYLDPEFPAEITTVVDWEDASQDLNLRVRSYLDMNCAHCHSDNSHCDYMSMRFAFNESILDENLGICIVPQENIDSSLSHIVKPGNTARSALFARVTSTQESIRMPLLGRSIVHQEAIDMIEEWINSLTTICN